MLTNFTRKKVSRVLRPKPNARKAYDRLSRWYDLLAGSEDWFTFHGLEMVSVQPGEQVLEIGFGTGKALLKMAKISGEKGLVVGLDLSWGMAQVSNEKLIHAGLHDRVSLNLGDGAALPFASRCYDVIFMGFTLELFDTPEIPQVLNECMRVLRPSGRLGVVSLARPEQFYPMVNAYEWFHRNFPDVADCRPIPAGEFLQQAGFALQGSQRKLMWGMPVDMVVGCKTVPQATVLHQIPAPQAFLN